MTIIDWMNQLLVHKKSWDSFSESDQKTFNSFIINRWLSMDMEFIEIVNVFQKYAIGTLEPREVYKWYCDVLPKGKRFNKYIKGKRDKKYDEWVVETLRTHFHESKTHIKDYLSLISEEELINILRLYGTDPKQIKNYCKRNF